MQESSQEASEQPTVADAHLEEGAVPAVVRVPARAVTSDRGLASDQDLLSKLRQSRLGRAYRSRLKSIPPVRAVVIWVWKTTYPLYLRFKLFRAKADTGPRGLITFSDYVEHNPGKVHTLLPASRVDVPLPGVYPNEDRYLFSALPDQYEFPEIRVAHVNDAIQFGGSNMVLWGELVIHHDLYDFAKDYTSEELHGRASIKPRRKRIRWLLDDKDPFVIPAAATFTDACAANYAHWMTEVLPRIMLFCSDERFADVPVVVDDGLHENIMNSLFRVVGGKREIITLPMGRALLVSDLYLVSVAGYVPFDRRFKKRATDSHGIFSAGSLTRLSRKLTDHPGQDSHGPSRKRIFLQRNSETRNITNAAEIEGLLGDYGFEAVDPGTLSFSDQVRVFRDAEIVVGATGAAFVNCIFSEPGTRIAILMGKHDSMIYQYWCNMLSPLGIDVSYVLGDITSERHLGIHGNFQIDKRDIRDLMTGFGCVEQQRPAR
jgi:capsular polysaccharide biosynthesis protein